MEKPFVSIIMPSYNTPAKELLEAINSVLEQSYKNYEFIIIDDGSDRYVENVIEGINDDRIFVSRNLSNAGLVYSLNKGLALARGKYVFRMDSDDVCLPNRIEKQVAYLELHHEVDVLSSFVQTFGELETCYKSEILDSEIKAELLWKNPIIHPTVVMRLESLKKRGIQYGEESVSEDFALWSKLAFDEDFIFAVMPEILLKYRIHSGQITNIKKNELKNDENRILRKNIEKIGITLSKKEIDTYLQFRNSENMSFKEIKQVNQVLREILIQLPDNISKKTLKNIYRKEMVKRIIKR